VQRRARSGQGDCDLITRTACLSRRLQECERDVCSNQCLSLTLANKREAALINWHLHSYERTQLVRRQIDQLHTRDAKTAVGCKSAVGEICSVCWNPGNYASTMSMPSALQIC
jgi:hypothetical protein